MQSKIELYRIILSRVAVLVGLFFYVMTRSWWSLRNDMMSHALLCIGIVLVSIAALGRMWCSLYIAGYKDDQLVTEGPYSLCRNPLYFFSFIGLMGIGFSTETMVFPLIFMALFRYYYQFVIKSEESRLRAIFGSSFEEYSRSTPAFFPRFSGYHEPEDYAVKPRVYRKHLLSALWFVWAIGLLQLIQGMKEAGWWATWWFLY